MASLKALTIEVVDWADQIAPNRQSKDAVVKAVSEMAELLDAVLNKDPNAVKEELGDMMILMVDLGNMYGVNIIDAGFQKMAINRARKWTAEDGVMRRVR